MKHADCKMTVGFNNQFLLPINSSFTHEFTCIRHTVRVLYFEHRVHVMLADTWLHVAELKLTLILQKVP